MHTAVKDIGQRQVQEPRGAPFDNIPKVCPEIVIASRSKTMKMLEKTNANVNPYQTTINPTTTHSHPAQILRISSAILPFPICASYGRLCCERYLNWNDFCLTNSTFHQNMFYFLLEGTLNFYCNKPSPHKHKQTQ
jgi:hypothetical protein